MLSLLYSSGKKRSERHWSSCPAVSLQPLLTTTDYFSHLNQSYSDALNHLHHHSPFYYHEEQLATPSSSTTTSTPSSATASTSTSTQLIVDLSMVTKVLVTVVKVGPYTTVKDFCDKVWDYIASLVRIIST